MQNRFLEKSLWGFLLPTLLYTLLFPLPSQAAPRLQDVGEELVIVIDPGHGGENQGTIENNHEEKTMTLVTAMAMYQELQLYENVQVYLTRTTDQELSLKERAEYAASVNADFLFSIHYNASENHELFGSEVWVSSLSPYNGYGYQFGYEFLTDMRDKGLFLRGVKTRLNSAGIDYYGIIRESVALQVPALIIEHCHVDEQRDAGYCDSNEKLEAFGRADATAVARYFGLKSSALQVDYSDYSLAEVPLGGIVPKTLPDTTAPDVCEIAFSSADYEAGVLSLEVAAADYDSPLLYYSYSCDGGRTFQPREPWPGSDTLTGNYSDTFTLQLKVESGICPEVIVRAYNLYDLYTESNLYVSPETFLYGQKEPEDADQEESSLTGPEEPKASLEAASGQVTLSREVSFLAFLKISLGIVVFLMLLLVISQAIVYTKRKKRRRQRNQQYQQRNDWGETKNQHK